jgi:hypothetical protein
MISGAPSRAGPALPPVGPLLGAAYDRALATAFKSWRVVAIGLALYYIATIFGGLVTAIIAVALMFAWLFFAMANAIRSVFGPEYRMTARSAGDLLVAGLVILTVVVLIGAGWFSFTIMIPLRVNPLLANLPAIIVDGWICGRYFCAPVLGARDATGIRSLRISARLTSIGYWHGITVFLVTSFTLWIVPALIESMSEALQFAFHVRPESVVWGAVAYATGTAVIVGWTYFGQAATLAACMWVNALEAARSR